MKRTIVKFILSVLFIIGFIYGIIILYIVFLEAFYIKNNDKPYDPEAYIKSCGEGNIHDCYEAGNAYSLKQDKIKAIESWTKACSNQNDSACFILGLSYRDGTRGVNKDIEKANDLLKKVCDKEENDKKLKIKVGCIEYHKLNN